MKKGQPLFKIDSKRQEADIETARARVVEVEAGMSTAKADVLTSQSKVDEAKANLQQAKDELDVKSELQRRNPGIVPQREIEKLQVLVDQRQAGVDAAECQQTGRGVAPFDRSTSAEGKRGGAVGGSRG